MIDERILNSLVSTFNDPSFSVFINGFHQNNECNKDEIIISVEQVTPNLFKLLQTKEYIIDELINLLKTKSIAVPADITNRNKEHINTIVEKKIILDSNIDVSPNKTIKSKIDGYVDILGYGNTPKYEVEGTIKNGILKLTFRGYPIYLPIDRFKVRKDKLYITVPNNIRNTTVTIDNVVRSTTKTNNVITVNCSGIHQGTHKLNIKYDIHEDITNQNIEVVVAPIAKKIEIGFNTPHIKIPAVILTVDQKDTNLYSTYETEFVIDEETNKYTGVNINFKNLRRKASYPNVNICILGE